MTKIIKFFLNRASYIAEDASGSRIDLNVDYWNNKFDLSRKSYDLEFFAKKLLKKKHKVNFVHKMLK